jgi:hypothetical protein
MNSESWVEVEPAKRGWLVVCHLCGVESHRAFESAAPDDGSAEADARQYAREHPLTAAHRAALRGYSSVVSDWLTPEELETARLLGTSEHELRLIAARRAIEQESP